jgi:positive regulator of sigma E activity
MFKSFIEWTEGDISRGRKVVLFSTVFIFLLITLGLFVSAIWGFKMATITTSLYVTLVGLMAAIYGFYTSTSSDKSNKLADQAADVMMKKLKEIQEKSVEETKEK